MRLENKEKLFIKRQKNILQKTSGEKNHLTSKPKEDYSKKFDKTK